jgi:hypothetical protein
MTVPPIDKNTPITLGLVILVLGVSFTAIFKAGQVLTEIDYLKAGIIEIKADVADMKRTVNSIDRQQRSSSTGQKSYQ